MRRYDQWGGNPDGTPERMEDCVAKVYNSFLGRWLQCAKPRGKGPDGLYCGQHAKMLADGKTLNVPEDNTSSTEGGA